MHLRRILTYFRTGSWYDSYWPNKETGRYWKQGRKDSTCAMCTHQIISPNLAPEELSAIDDDDEERSNPIEDEHRATCSCSGYADASRAIL